MTAVTKLATLTSHPPPHSTQFLRNLTHAFGPRFAYLSLSPLILFLYIPTLRAVRFLSDYCFIHLNLFDFKVAIMSCFYQLCIFSKYISTNSLNEKLGLTKLKKWNVNTVTKKTKECEMKDVEFFCNKRT